MIQIAWAMLILWPFVSMFFFRAFTAPVALSLTLVGGFLFLPAGVSVDLPTLPPIDKNTVPSLSAFLLTVIVSRNRDPRGLMAVGWLPRQPLALGLMGLLVVGAFGTALTNMDSVVHGPVVLPGLAVYDALAIGLGSLMMLLPFFLARKVLASPEAQVAFLKIFASAMLIYSCLALWEVRMSPQLNYQLYGFFPHDWTQHIRSGGFRPVVFLPHGLVLGILMSCAVIVAIGLSRMSDIRNRARWLLGAVWLVATIVLSKVFGALLITLALIPIAFQATRIQVLAAAAFASMVLMYPMLRAVDVVPVDRIVTISEQFSAERAGSLQYRLDNEKALLERARERPLLGWGGFGRNRVYDDFGRDVSVTDGAWVIIFGQGGWIRYIAEFGLLTGGIILLAFGRRRVHPAFAITALALAANLLDLLPNSGISPVTWMFAGAIFGCLERRHVTAEPVPDAPSIDPQRRPVYQRTSETPRPAAPALRTEPKLRRDFGETGPKMHRRN